MRQMRFSLIESYGFSKVRVIAVFLLCRRRLRRLIHQRLH